MANKMAIKKLPKASITVVGSGTMQWSKDKQIDVIQGMHCAASQLLLPTSELLLPTLKTLPEQPVGIN